MSEFEALKRFAAQQDAVRAVIGERGSQDEMFGRQVHDPAYWLAILGKQVGQLGQAVIRHKWRSDYVSDAVTQGTMYHEAKQVAAVAIALMEAITLRELPDEVTSVRPKDPRKLARALGIDDERLHATFGDEEEGMSNDLC